MAEEKEAQQEPTDEQAQADLQVPDEEAGEVKGGAFKGKFDADRDPQVGKVHGF